jgi:hypothetical protein
MFQDNKVLSYKRLVALSQITPVLFRPRLKNCAHLCLRQSDCFDWYGAGVNSLNLVG